MNKLININKQEINQEVIDTVSARELHKFLGSKQDFSTWIKNRIEKYEFVENQDYIRFHKKWKRIIQQWLSITSLLTWLKSYL